MKTWNVFKQSNGILEFYGTVQAEDFTTAIGKARRFKQITWPIVEWVWCLK